MMKLISKIPFEHALMFLVVLNLLDAVSTHAALSLGIAYELNPILRWAFDTSPALFWIVKMTLVSGGLFIVGFVAPEKVAWNVVMSANALYLLVILVHAYGWVAYLLNRFVIGQV